MAKEKTPTAADERRAKYPDLVAISEKLEDEKEKILAKSAPIRKKRDALEAKVQEMLGEIRDLNKQIHKIERPRMGEIDNQLGGFARAMGARSLANPEG